MTIERLFTIFVCFVTTPCICSQQKFTNPILFDDNWLFHRGSALGADKVDFDDSFWRSIDLPHDWSIENRPGTDSPFTQDALSNTSSGFTEGGTGWYRKRFTIPDEQKGNRVFLLFDGVYMNAEVWINGALVGTHPYGYTSFWFDITDQLRFDGQNVCSVKVMNEGENSRWYSGSGIYRHVWLMVKDQFYIEPWGTYITTPVVSDSEAKVKVQTDVINKYKQPVEVLFISKIKNANGQQVATSSVKQSVPGNNSKTIKQDLKLSNPARWSMDSPNLFTVSTEVFLNNELVDHVENKFGIRTISFDVVNGFQLNDIPVKLKGGCLHHDNGPLGARAYDRAEERKVELLKASGFNAVRCSHNPPSVAFLDACDRLGLVVIDEAFDMWKDGKNPYDYHMYFESWWQKDIESMLRRDRNHPSVILWSIGNEIRHMDSPEVVKTAKELADFVHKLEPTRPVTAAVNGLSADKDLFFGVLDIAGYNYAHGGDHLVQDIYARDHDRVPSRVMFGAESYPLEAFHSWMSVLDNRWVIGDFVWAAMDYLGEASIGWRGYWHDQSFYPWNLAYCGDIDNCGWKRPQSYYRDVLWKSDQISIFVASPQPSFPPNPKRESWSKWHWHDWVADWSWKGQEGKPFEVFVLSSCEEVELLLGGKSLGKKTSNRSNQFITSWEVPFMAGVLKAVGYRNKKQVNSAELRTADDPKQLVMKADRTEIKTDGQDLSYVVVELTDAAGNINPKVDRLVRFEVEGPASIVGVGNGNPVCVESFQSDHRNTWRGRCLVILKSKKESGRILLKASVDGLKPSVISINDSKISME